MSRYQKGKTFLVPAHLGSPGKRAVERVCVCVGFKTLLHTIPYVYGKVFNIEVVISFPAFLSHVDFIAVNQLV